MKTASIRLPIKRSYSQVKTILVQSISPAKSFCPEPSDQRNMYEAQGNQRVNADLESMVRNSTHPIVVDFRQTCREVIQTTLSVIDHIKANPAFASDYFAGLTSVQEEATALIEELRTASLDHPDISGELGFMRSKVQQYSDVADEFVQTKLDKSTLACGSLLQTIDHQAHVLTEMKNEIDLQANASDHELNETQSAQIEIRHMAEGPKSRANPHENDPECARKLEETLELARLSTKLSQHELDQLQVKQFDADPASLIRDSIENISEEYWKTCKGIIRTIDFLIYRIKTNPAFASDYLSSLDSVQEEATNLIEELRTASRDYPDISREMDHLRLKLQAHLSSAVVFARTKFDKFTLACGSLLQTIDHQAHVLTEMKNRIDLQANASDHELDEIQSARIEIRHMAEALKSRATPYKNDPECARKVAETLELAYLSTRLSHYELTQPMLST